MQESIEQEEVRSTSNPSKTCPDSFLVSTLLGIGQASLRNGDFETYNHIKPKTFHSEFIDIKIKGSVGIIVFGNYGWLWERGSGFYNFSWRGKHLAPKLGVEWRVTSKRAGGLRTLGFGSLHVGCHRCLSLHDLHYQRNLLLMKRCTRTCKSVFGGWKAVLPPCELQGLIGLGNKHLHPLSHLPKDDWLLTTEGNTQ